MILNKQNRISLFVFFILAFLLFFGRILLPRFETHNVLAIISWDVFGYYLYLPATFLHHDLGIRDFSWVQHILDTYNPTIGFYQAYPGPEGRYVLKYTMGLALLYAPFFFIGHLFALGLGFPADGFSLPYQVAVAFGSIVIAVTGIWIMRKVLLKFFTDAVTSITLILLVLGTNYFQLTAYDGAMAHNSLFTLYAFILWFTIRWLEEQKWRYGILLGLMCGIAVLVRPTEIICVLIPLLWGIFDKASFRNKYELVRKNIIKVIVICIIFLAVPALQLMYWKIYSGRFLYYSYESNEKLELIARHLPDVLFSYKKGWLVYAPIMIFPLIGFYFLKRSVKQSFWPVLVFFFVNLLIISSWTTWWFGGSIGQRSMMQSYTLLAFPLGAFIAWMSGKSWKWKIPLYSTFLLCIALNLFQTWQYMNFLIDPSRMTKRYYWAIFGRTHVPEKAKRYLELVETNEIENLTDSTAYNRRILASYDFESGGNSCVETFARSGKYSFHMDKEQQYSPGIKIPFSDLTKKEENVWVRASAFVYFTCDPKEVLANLVMTCNHMGRNYKYKSVVFENLDLKPDTWNEITMDYLLPFIPDESDQLQVYFWYRGEKEIFLDDFTIRVFEPKE